MIFIQKRAFDYHARGLSDARRVVRTVQEFQQMMHILLQQRVVAWDTETSGLAWYRSARICGYSFTCRIGGALHSWYVPYRHATGEHQLPENLAIQGMRDILENPCIEIIMHNAKFDWHMARADGVDIIGPRRDTMIEATLFDENSNIGLKSRANSDLKNAYASVYESILNGEIKNRAKDAKMGITEYKDRFGYSHVPTGMAGMYACMDTEFTFELAEFYDAQNIRGQYASTYEREIALTEALLEMEENGLSVDTDYIHALKGRAADTLDQLAPRIFKLLDNYVFNIGSDDELRHVLIRRLGLNLWKRTKKGDNLSVDKEVLEEFEDVHPACELILQYRQASKILTTYTDSILKHIGHDGLLHGAFRQVGAATGRLSSNAPNLQNFAGDSNKRAIAHTGLALDKGGIDPLSVKRAFVNRGPGWCRGYFDYSQIELRVLAYYSKDPTMTDVYVRNDDIHERTRMEVFGEEGKRRDAKVINFGLSYCLSAAGLARGAKMALPTAEHFMNTFFKRYPRIGPFRHEFWNAISTQKGYFENIFGRPRRVPEITSVNGQRRTRAQRVAIGSLIQGTAAELTKISIIRLHQWNKAHRLGLKLCTTIHDEIQIDIPKPDFIPIARGVKHIMQDFNQFGVIPAITDVEYMETNWSEKKGVEVD